MNNDKNLVLFEYDEKSQNFKYNTEKIQKQKKNKNYQATKLI
ncbi:hypothetical protein [Campylobacter molothri]